MKKISLALSAIMLLGLTACDNDDKDNVLVMPAPESLEVQTPAYASSEWILDKANTFTLTSTGVNYGNIGPVQYAAQVALDDTFEKFENLNPTDNSSKDLTFKDSDLNSAINNLYGFDFDNWEDLGFVPVFVRVYSTLAANNSTIVYSNAVKFDQVCTYRPSPLTTGNPTGVYLRGGMNGWGAEPDWEFLTTNDGSIYELRDVNIPAGTEFKVADANWADINLGGTDDNSQITPEEPFELTDNGTNLVMDIDFIGNVTLTNNHGTYSVLFHVTDSSAPTGIFLRGDMNGWGAEAAWEFQATQFSNTYVLDGVSINAGVGFKVADANWGPIDYGYNGGTPMNFDETYPLDHGGANITLAENFSGTVYLTVDGENFSLRFEVYLPDQPSGIYLRGGMNGWGAEPDWEFLTTTSKTEWILTGVTIDAGTEFKVADANWSPIDFGYSGAVVFGSPMELVHAGANIVMPETATFTAILRQDGETYYLTFDK